MIADDIAAAREIMEELAVKWGWRDGRFGPGAMEGNPKYAPYFWEQFMDGMADDDPVGNWEVICIVDEEREAFQLGAGPDFVLMGQDENGFIHIRLVSQAELALMRREDQNASQVL